MMASIKKGETIKVTFPPSETLAEMVVNKVTQADTLQFGVSLERASNTLYTWAFLPTRIDGKDTAIRFLDTLMIVPIHKYFWKDIEPVLDVLCAVNQLIRTEGEFEFYQYGDFFLYAMLMVEDFSPYYLYVFCAGHNMPLDNDVKILFEGKPINARWLPETGD